MKSVLFVRIENSCRSQMAEGFARELGEKVVEAYSAGSRPSGIVNPKAVAAMEQVGINISASTSKGFDKLPESEWDVIVTMGCGDACPFLPSKERIDWDLPDPKDLPEHEFKEVRDEIRARVRELVVKLAEKRSRP